MAQLASASKTARHLPRRDEVLRAIEASWSGETSSDPERWSFTNGAWGQCAVSALVIQDYLGGALLRGQMADGSHYWNALPDGTELDATIHQFTDPPEFTHIAPRAREVLLENPATRRRYRHLADRVRRALQG